MRKHKLGTAGLAAGLALVLAPAAQAACVYCDSTGCHVTTGSCPSGSGGSAAFAGTWHSDCFGCGTSTGTMALTMAGASAAGAVYDGAATATFIENEGTGVDCLISGSAQGTVTGVVSFAFNWTRLGAIALITTTGDVNGAGTAVFQVTSPVGNPCGSAVDALVAGDIAGT